MPEYARPTPPTATSPSPGSGGELPPRLMAKLKVEVEGFELLERLGAGGQATVYKARRTKDGLLVAIKILHSGPHADEQARARLKRETNALRAINHPNIVHAIAAGRTRSGLDCLVMSYIDGRPLDALWENAAFAAAVAPEPADRLRLFKLICETVQAAHRKGITHRDLSPSNILIDKQGQPHILDFGMASTAFDGIISRDITVTGQFIGKLKYASPEQARGSGAGSTNHAKRSADDSGADIRSDVYALGVMLYQLLTGGGFPYEVVGNVIDVLNNIIHSKPRPPSVRLADPHTPTASMVIVSPLSKHDGSAKGAIPSVSARPAPSIRRNPPLVNETIEAVVMKALEKDPDHRYQSAGELAADMGRYLAGQPTSAVIWSKRPKPAAASRFVTHRRTLLAAASIILIFILIGITMNARTLAVWFGLTTVAAVPAVLTEFAQGAAMMEPEFPSEIQPGDKRLNKLADDLALVEARLRAVNRQLDVVGIKPPELEEHTGRSGPLSADVFIERLADTSVETGRPLAFALMDKEDRERQEKAEADALSRETDKDVLLTKRRNLDAQQAALWMQISCGTFTGRDVDRIFRYRAKAPQPMTDANDARNKALQSGVKVRRTIDANFRSIADELSAAGGLETDESADLSTLLTTAAAQPRESLVTFRTATMDAKDANGMNEDDLQAMEELSTLAKQLLDSLDGAAESQARLDKDGGEMPRFINRGRLQQDVLDATAAAARLDQRLVALSKTWQVEMNTSSKLPPLAPEVAQQKEKSSQRAKEPVARATLLPVGSEWTGRCQVFVAGKYRDASAINVIVTERAGDRVVLDWNMPDYNGRVRIDATLVGDRLAGIYAKKIAGKFSADTIGNATITGIVDQDGTRIVGGTYDVPGSNPHRTGTWELKRLDPAAADTLSAWTVGSRWTTKDQNGTLRVWTVVSRLPRELQIERPSDGGQGTVRLTLSVTGTTVALTQVAHVGTKRPVRNREWQGIGTIGPTALKLSFSVVSDSGPRWRESMDLRPE